GLRQARANIVLVVGGHAFEPADRDRILFNTSAPARRLAGPVAGASENAGKHVRMPIDHVGVAVAPGCDQSDVFGNGCMRRAGPLAVDHLVEVVRRRNVSRLHLLLVPAPQHAADEGWEPRSVSDPSANPSPVGFAVPNPRIYSGQGTRMPPLRSHNPTSSAAV